MFGMGFFEIFLILLVAIIALGPEKLPGAIVGTVKFFKKIKGEISEAKSTLDKELEISQLKKDVTQFKESIPNINNVVDIDLDEITEATTEPTKIIQEEIQEVKKIAKKSSKKEKIILNKGKKA